MAVIISKQKNSINSNRARSKVKIIIVTRMANKIIDREFEFFEIEFSCIKSFQNVSSKQSDSKCQKGIEKKPYSLCWGT